jgi:DNA mismatch repair ATPase MutS
VQYGIACAEMAGVPKEVLLRAHHVSQKLRKNESVDRLQTQSALQEQERNFDIITRFKDLDCTSIEQVQSFLSYLKTIETERQAANESIRSSAEVANESDPD